MLQIVVDQALSSGSAYVLVLLIARASSPGDFGVFLICFGTVMLAITLARSALGSILGMDLLRLGEDRGRELRERSAGAAIVLGGVAACGLVVLALLTGGPLRVVICLLALGLPLILLQDLSRVSVISRGHPTTAIAADALWLGPCLLLLVADLARGEATRPFAASLIWLLGLGLSIAWLRSRREFVRPRLEGLRAWLGQDRRRQHLAGDSLLAGLAPVGNAAGAAYVAGAALTAAVRGSAAMLAPIATLGLAVSVGAVPEAKRRPSTALRFLVGVTALLVLASAAWGMLLFTLPNSAGEAILGASWATARPVVPIVAVEYVGLAMWTGATSMLRYTDATDTALHIRLAYAPACLLLPVAALAFFDDARAFAGTLAALGLLVGAVGLWLGVRQFRA